MNIRKYLVRAFKYVIYFHVLCALLYALMLFFGEQSVNWHTLLQFFSLRLISGIVILGLLYPIFGFNRLQISLPDGGWKKHGKDLYEVMALCGFRILQKENEKVIFCATNTMRRILSLYEETIILEIEDNVLKISGLRKDVARVKLRVNDYLRRV
ncbi:MAG: hypothetical protein ACRCSB_05860 [Bacteroidales bacterium]